MSDAARQNLKVSREGIVLIKSFEGFRPRAIQRAEGGWIIGYGHTLSAREGATVSEADAELLLRYDLLPVEKSVNDTVPTALNQHQFDALVSFAFSVGVDRFASSDVRQRMNAGAPGEAADAMMGWPEPALPETALRRRAAERALFVANPAVPVALSDLLAAPLPPPAVASLVEPTPAADAPAEPKADAPVSDTLVSGERTEADATPTDAEAAVETVAQLEAEPAEAEPTDTTEPVAVVDSRGAAVAALLGEPADRLVHPDAVIVPFWRGPVATETAPSEVAAPEPVDRDEPGEAASSEAPVSEAPVFEAPGSDEAESAIAPTEESAPEPQTNPAPTSDIGAWAAARYAPYSSVMVGPLPYLQPVNATPFAEPDPSATTAPTVDEVGAPQSEAQQSEAQAAPVVEADTVETQPLVAEPDAFPVETQVPEPAPGGWTSVAPVPATELILTPLDDTAELAIARPLWTPEQRDEPDGSETNLFGEDLSLTLGGAPVMRHEIEMEAPARFDWKETGPFIFMGVVGLVSFGAAMAAFRRAAEQSGGGDLTIIGWVLALIGLGCVGVSSVNLYRKFGLPGGD